MPGSVKVPSRLQKSIMISAILVSVLAPVRAALAQPTLPWVAEDVCPGERCQFGTRTVLEPVEFRAAPSDSAPVIGRLHSGDAVSIETGQMHVSKPGRAVAEDSVKVFAADGATRWVPPGDTLFVLHYSSEGLFKIWYQQSMFQVFWFWDDPMMGAPHAEGPQGSLVERGQREWWLQVRGRGGVGWFKHRPGALGPLEAGTSANKTATASRLCRSGLRHGPLGAGSSVAAER